MNKLTHLFDKNRAWSEAIRKRDDPAVQVRLATEVREIVERFPVPGLPAA